LGTPPAAEKGERSRHHSRLHRKIMMPVSAYAACRKAGAGRGIAGAGRGTDEPVSLLEARPHFVYE
jgi:hypothetical protein